MSIIEKAIFSIKIYCSQPVCKNDHLAFTLPMLSSVSYNQLNNYPLANEVAMGYNNATVRPSVRPSFLASFRNILVNTLGSTSFNGF